MKTLWVSRMVMFTFFTIGTLIACKKEGVGGKSSVNGYVKHHSLPIANTIVYIKYGALQFPGTDLSLYDASSICDSTASYKFENLVKGDYYLYAVGFDSTVMKAVTGGVDVKLRQNKSTITDIPITE